MNFLVSIIIRTCNRPELLENAIKCVINQTYKNIELIIVEDGKDNSKRIIDKYKDSIKIKYFFTNNKVGRCKVGNIGLENAEGTYINFLDDDDIFYAAHVEKLVTSLCETKKRVAYSIAEEAQIKKTKNGIKVKRMIVRYKQPFNRLLLTYINYIPIQSIMFEKTVYEECGGFDEALDMLEDWNLWLRFSVDNIFQFLPEVTSRYHVPYKNMKLQRSGELRTGENIVKDKMKQYYAKMNYFEFNNEMDYILNVYNKKGILHYVKKIRNYLLYKDI